ncbi:hypothetical protein EV2_009085 [Malus domestica]
MVEMQKAVTVHYGSYCSHGGLNSGLPGRRALRVELLSQTSCKNYLATLFLPSSSQRQATNFTGSLSLSLFALSLPSSSQRRATKIFRGSAATYEIGSCRSFVKIAASLGFAARFKPPRLSPSPPQAPSECLGGRLCPSHITEHFSLNRVEAPPPSA